MALQYYLVPNHITPDPDDYMAVSINPQTYTLEDVLDYMTREGSTITTAEALANFEEITRGIRSLVFQGHNVNTPLVNFSPGMSGVFNGEDDRFDPSRHSTKINTNPGVRMRPQNGEIDVEKIAPRQQLPVVRRYHDNASETQDEMITPVMGARITGSYLKFDEEDPNQGIFFINTADHTETRVETRMLRNKPGELIFSNPELAAGTYKLEVRTIIHSTTSIRTGTLLPELTVAGPE